MRLKFQRFGSVCLFADLPAFSFIRDGGDIDEKTKQKEEKGISGKFHSRYWEEPFVLGIDVTAKLLGTIKL